MPQEFSALFEHHFDPTQLAALPELLNRSWPPFEEFWPSYEIVDRADADVFNEVFWKWRDGGDATRPDDYSRMPAMKGPCGFNGRVGRRLVLITHGTQWQHFLKEDTVRFILRETCRLFAQVFESEHWIYYANRGVRLRELLALGGRKADLVEVAAWLRAEPQITGCHIDAEEPVAGHIDDDYDYLEDSFQFRLLL